MKLYAETNPNKIKILLIENNEPQYYDEIILRDEEKKGNVYLGEITSINTSLNGVFVNFTNGQSGFLSFYSIHPFYFQINEKEKSILIKNLEKEQKTLKESSFYKKYMLENVIKKGQKVIVQIIRKSHGKKGAMLSTFISLGREFSYLPNSLKNEIVFGEIPNIIKDNIRNIFNKWNCNGFFLLSKMPHDPSFLDKLEGMIKFWQCLTPNIHNEPIGLLYTEENEIISNYLLEKTKTIFYCGDFNMEEFIKNRGFNIEVIKKNDPLRQWKNYIDNIWNNQVFLKSGAYIFFNYCEGGTFIDVNIGSNTKSSFLQINIEAMNVICKQIKLRNISGIIFIDFIDMTNDWEQITRQMEILLAGKNKIQIVTVANLGNIIIYRQNLGGFQCSNYFEKRQKWSVEKVAENMFDKIYNKTGILEISNDLLQFCKNKFLIPQNIKIKFVQGEKKWKFFENNSNI